MRPVEPMTDMSPDPSTHGSDGVVTIELAQNDVINTMSYAYMAFW